MDLLEIRNEIDRIDAQIVSLYEKRMDASKRVAQFKIETGKKVFDKKREEEKIRTVKSLASNEFNRHGIEELFEQIMSMSRKLQYQLLAEKGSLGKLPFIGVDELDTGKARVVFQGAPGAYSELAMKNYFGDQVNCFHVDTFRDAMSAIDEGSADFAVLPIENSTAGIVSEIYDLLVEYENYIVGEQIIRIEHCLLGLPQAQLEDIRRVYSHPQSLMQSARFLDQHSDWHQYEKQRFCRIQDHHGRGSDAGGDRIRSRCEGIRTEGASERDQPERYKLHALYHCFKPEDLPKRCT